jgi:hypothetical protein
MARTVLAGARRSRARSSDSGPEWLGRGVTHDTGTAPMLVAEAFRHAQLPAQDSQSITHMTRKCSESKSVSLLSANGSKNLSVSSFFRQNSLSRSPKAKGQRGDNVPLDVLDPAAQRTTQPALRALTAVPTHPTTTEPCRPSSSSSPRARASGRCRPRYASDSTCHICHLCRVVTGKAVTAN